MASHFSGLLQITRSLNNFAISNDAAIGLLKGTLGQKLDTILVRNTIT